MGVACSSASKTAENEVPDKPQLILAMRIFGAIIALFSIVQFGIGGAAYSYFTNVKLGAWWGSILTFVAGLLGAYSKPKGTIIAGIVVGSIAFIIAAIGSSVDGVAALVFASENVCISSSGTISGDSTYSSQVALCQLVEPGFDCVCASALSSYSWTCFEYNGHPNCADIITAYPSLLKASSGMLAFLTVTTFVYTILSCVSACRCCKGAAPVADASLNKQSTQTQAWTSAPAAQAQPVVVQFVPQGQPGQPGQPAQPGQPQQYQPLPQQYPPGQQPPVQYQQYPPVQQPPGQYQQYPPGQYQQYPPGQQPVQYQYPPGQQPQQYQYPPGQQPPGQVQYPPVAQAVQA
jgi:hypothetical protein